MNHNESMMTFQQGRKKNTRNQMNYHKDPQILSVHSVHPGFRAQRCSTLRPPGFWNFGILQIPRDFPRQIMIPPGRKTKKQNNIGTRAVNRKTTYLINALRSKVALL